MTHHNEQKHQQHMKEREHEKKLAKEREEKEMQSPASIHPAWFIALGVVLVIGVVVVWIFTWW
jgi:hypothetical protein